MRQCIPQIACVCLRAAVALVALTAHQVCASVVIINEFMAVNNSILQDQDGDYSDWIELHNASADTVLLAGWHLTDDSDDLAGWTFPAVDIAPHSFLVVFASGKNRAVAGSELHTDFRLSGDGEFLALVHPDGVTVAHSFSPAYPPQLADISYGYSLQYTSAMPLVVEGSACRIMVPSDGSSGTDWTQRGFDDAGWSTGPTAVGYDRTADYDAVIATDIESVMYPDSPGCYLRIPFTVSDPSDFSWLLLDMKYDDGFAAYINGHKVAAANAPEPLAWDSEAVQEHDAAVDGEFERFHVLYAQDILAGGANVLAIHGLNLQVNPRVDDFLILPELLGANSALVPGPLAEPTPGSANDPDWGGPGPSDFTAVPEFEPGRGFYSDALSVTLSSATAGARIYYTANFSEPTTNDLLYTGPIAIDGMAALRARAFEASSYLPSVSVAHTYLYPDQVANQTSTPPGYPDTWGVFVIGPNTGLPAPADYDVWPQAVAEHAATLVDDLKSLPSLSVVMDIQEMFGSDGLYCVPFPDEADREHAASLEWIDPESQQGFNVNAGMRVFGGGVRVESSKQTFMVRFRRDYGGPSKLEFPLFADYQMDSVVEAVDEFETLALRSIHGDAWHHPTAQYIIDSFVRRSQLAMGVPGVHGRWVHMYINGLYWGIYNVTERPDGDYAASYFGGNKEDYDAVKHPSKTLEPPTTEYEVIDGDSAAWQSALNLAAAGVGGSQAYEQFKGLVDVENLADYILLAHYVVYNDWPVNNWYANRRREPGAGFRFYVWDAEYALGRGSGDGYQSSRLDVAAPGTPAFLYNAARQNVEFRVLFGDRVHKHMFNNGALTVEANVARYEALAARVDGGIRTESVRWGDCNRSSNPYFTPFTYSGDWLPVINNTLTSWLPQRHAFALNHLVSAGLYPTVSAPVFHVDGVNQHGGPFATGAMLSISGGGTIYYTLDGTDPRANGGGIRGTQYTGAIPLEYSVQVKARRYVSASQWSALHEAFYINTNSVPLRISEVMYHPRDPEPGTVETNYTTTDFEFIELMNTGSETLGLRGVKFTDAVTFDFTLGDVTTVDPGQRVVVVRNRDAFAERYDTNSVLIAGEYQQVHYFPVRTLSDAGERIVLQDGLGRILASFTYNDARRWPQSADGAGHSLAPLVLNDQSDGLLDYWGNWRASAFIDGSPGAADPEPAASVVVNELGAHTDTELPPYDSDDWIELHNPLGVPVDVGGWYLSDNGDDLKRYRIDDGTVIEAGGYMLLTENLHFHTNRLDGSGFGLNKAGESVFLSHLPGTSEDRVVDAVRFKGQDSGVSLGRYPDGGTYLHALSPTTNAANAVPELRVLISEIMYHPAPTVANPENNTNDEYIEICNPLDTPVELWTAAGPWRIDGGVSYTFPGNTTLPARSCVVVVPFDPVSDAAALNAFLAAYSLSNGQVAMLGPYDRALDNRTERITLEKPQRPDAPGDPVSWIVVDEAIYFDRDPWPAGTDGTGLPLQRGIGPGAGNDPGNWMKGFGATPGLSAEKVTILRPEEGERLFALNAFEVAVAVDYVGVSGSVQQVEFFVDGVTVEVDTTEPYEHPVSLPAAGRYGLHAELTDAAGVSTSRQVTVTALELRDDGASGVSDSTADLDGELTGGSAQVSVCWGTTDGGTDTGSWEDTATVGWVTNGGFSVHLEGLAQNRTYYYRFLGEADGNEGWSAAGSFRTGSFILWSYVMEMSFDGYGGADALTNFPVLVKLHAGLTNFSYGQFASGAGNDLRFADGTGETLSYEIEHWDTNGTSYVWVRVPVLTNGAVVRAYWGYGPAGAAPPQYAVDGSVWSEGYEAVWHLGGDGHDATGNGMTATAHGCTDAAGVAGAGQQFDGVDDWLEPGFGAAWYAGAGRSVSLWVMPGAGVLDSATPFGADGGAGGTDVAWTMETSPRWQDWRALMHGQETTVDDYTTGQWQLLSLVISNGVIHAARDDGALVQVWAGGGFTPAHAPVVGRRGGAGNWFEGGIDEVRMSGTARSADWIRAEYQTVAQNAVFTSYGEVLEQGPPRDIDGDGLPDDWEEHYFGGAGTDPDSQSDGDGMNDGDEYTAGTDPTNSLSYFGVRIELSNGVPVVWFMGLEAAGPGYDGFDRYYDLERHTNMLDGGWTGLVPYVNVPGTGAPVVWTNGPSMPHPAFFRGKVRLQPSP